MISEKSTERTELKELLENLYERYNNPEFIEEDPISIPHRYSDPADIEISAFLAATIAWGNRKAIVKSAGRMMQFMDDSPRDFTLNASESELAGVNKFVHRTFNGGDFLHFILALRQLTVRFGGIGAFFDREWNQCRDMRIVFSRFRREFFSCDHPSRCEKHLSSIDKGAACKRLNMYLRWMVRSDGRGVDFGLWNNIPASALYMPLDVHSGNVGRALGLLARRQNDWKSVEELTETLRGFDSEDPVKYDFALFGAGIAGVIGKEAI